MSSHNANNPQNDFELHLQEVGGYIYGALQDVAYEKGGEVLRQEVIDAAQPFNVLPNVAALALLKDRYPGSAEEVMTRFQEIQNNEYTTKQARQAEMFRAHEAHLNKQQPGIGRVMLQGIMTIMGVDSPHHLKSHEEFEQDYDEFKRKFEESKNNRDDGDTV